VTAVQVVTGGKFPLLQSGLNKGNSKEIITVSSSMDDRGIDTYTYKKMQDTKGDWKPAPQAAPHDEPVYNKAWRGVQDWWHENIENHDWSNNPFAPESGDGTVVVPPLMPVF
jgi:hypothetical protein